MSDSENENENEREEFLDEKEIQDSEEAEFEENLDAMLEVQNNMIRYIKKEGLPIAENITIEILLDFANHISEEFNK
jgi:hypothetical protein